jgi:hypothetical protein
MHKRSLLGLEFHKELQVRPESLRPDLETCLPSLACEVQHAVAGEFVQPNPDTDRR